LQLLHLHSFLLAQFDLLSLLEKCRVLLLGVHLPGNADVLLCLLGVLRGLLIGLLVAQGHVLPKCGVAATPAAFTLAEPGEGDLVLCSGLGSAQGVREVLRVLKRGPVAGRDADVEGLGGLECNGNWSLSLQASEDQHTG
jgi:hypothetical protein